MSPLAGRLRRRLASLLVRGPGAPVILGDIEESLRRDLSQGMPRGRALRRCLVNVVRSAWSLSRERLRRGIGRLPSPPVSPLDVKLGLRMLAKRPLLTAVAGLSLAIGIPVGLAPAFLIDAFEAPLPVEDGGRILALRYWEIERPRAAATTWDDLRFWSERLTAFETLGAARTVEHNLEGGVASPAPVSGAEVTASTFAVLGVRPLLGRTLARSDESPTAPPVVVLGEALWRSRLAGDPQAIGRTVGVGGVPHTVVGIMPEDFLFPVRQEIWLPLRESAPGAAEAERPLRVFGRLADGSTDEAARSELSAIGVRPHPGEPGRGARIRPEAVPYAVAANGLPAGGARGLPGVFWLLEVGAMILLTVACVNVSLLIFARAATRSTELAVRSALGASRARLVGQVLVEALVLALVATGAGLLLLAWLPDRVATLVRPLESGGLPYWVDFRVTGRTVARALALAAFSAALSAVVPALRITGKTLQRSLQTARAGSAAGFRFGLVTTALIVADIAFAVVGIAFTLGIGNRMANVVIATDLAALPTDEILAVELRFAPSPPGDAEAPESASARATGRAAIQRGLVARLEEDPRVRSVAVASRLPRMDHSSAIVEVEGGGRPVSFPSAMVDPGFFEALGQPVVAGRGFHAGDLEGDRSAVIVNTGFVELAMGGEHPVGRRIRRVSSLGGDDPGPWLEVVGLVPSLGMDPTEPEDLGAGVYFPAAPGEMNPLWLAVHVGPDPTSFAPFFRELTADTDPSVMISRITPLADVVPEDWYEFHAILAGWGVFVLILLTLASSGVYAMMAFTVAQRTREIGIRSALGARKADIAVEIGRRALIQLGSGGVIGMLLAGRVYHAIREGTVTGGTALAVAALPALGVLLLVGVLACTAPLRRALRIEPTEAMRSE